MVQGLNNEIMLVQRLENQLQRSLRPVTPDPAFIGHLHNRLRSPSELVIERRQHTALGLLLLAISLLSGFLVVLVLKLNHPSSNTVDKTEVVLENPELAL